MHNSDDNIDYVFKCVVIGDAYVGKTTILSNYTGISHFVETEKNYLPTIGVDFFVKTVKYINSNGISTLIRLHIYDTAGQERFDSITESYYKGVTGALLVFDTTNEKTFNSVKKWLNRLKEKCEEEISIILVGNKTENIKEREVKQLDINRYARENNLCWSEISGKEKINIIEPFDILIKSVVLKIEQGIIKEENFANLGITRRSDKKQLEPYSSSSLFDCFKF